MDHQPLLLTENLRRFALHQRDKTACVDEFGELSYGALWEAMLAVSGGLAALGVQSGDRVATALPPSIPHLVILLGAMLRGAIPCTLNIRLTQAEFRRFLAPIGARLIVCDDEHHGAVRELGAEVLRLDEVHAPVSIEGRLGRLWSRTAEMPRLDEQAPALIIPTGGTTGVPKGAIFTHRSLWLWGASIATNLGRASIDTELMVAPFFHVSVLTGPMSTLFTGGTVRILRHFSSGAALEAIAGGATLMQAAVTIYSKLKQDPAFASTDRLSMRFLSFGSMPATPEFIDTLVSDYPNARLRLTYGATEFGPVSALQHEHILGGDLTSAGHPLPGVGIRIVDDTGRELPRGEAGEIEVNCPWQTHGYWGLPEETAATYYPSGIRLGDIGYFNDRSRLVVSGRKKEMLISGGENVFPREVEEVLCRHPAVAEVVVYGARDDYWGDRIEAAVVTKPGCTITREELVAFGRRELGGYKLPKAMVLLPSIPLTPNNKPDRRQLVLMAEQRAAGRQALGPEKSPG
jgi:acyl-CoA synthetase (AMP-forming)/AMP-acid ligase II